MWNSSWLKVCKSLFEFTNPITSFKGNSQIRALCIGWQKIVAFLNSSGASQVVSVVKNPPANAGDSRDMGLIPGSRRSSGEENGNPLHSSILAWEIPWTEELEGYSPQGHKESDTTEWPSTRFEGLCSIQARLRSLGRVYKNNLGLSLY